MKRLKWPVVISWKENLYEFISANQDQAIYSTLFKSGEKRLILNHEQAYLAGTVFLQGEDASDFIKNGYCERCLRPAREWAKMDALGIAVAGDYDRGGNLVGFLCPECGFIRQ